MNIIFPNTQILLEKTEPYENQSKREEKVIHGGTNNTEEDITQKKKLINEDQQNASNSNEKEIIFVDLNDEEKHVYSQLGINPLIKLGKEYINTNTIAKLEINSQNEERNISKKSTSFLEPSGDIKHLNQSTNESNDKNDILDKQKEAIVDKEDAIEINSDNEIDISRRKRRRSSASSE